MHSLHNVEAEDITRQTNINVEAGGTKTVNVSACVVDGQLNLKFLGSSTATSDSDASTQTVYVSNVKVTRLATNSSASKPTIFIASDSTVQTYESNYYPQTGWGQTLAQLPQDSQSVSFRSGPNGASIRVLVPIFSLCNVPLHATLLQVLTHLWQLIHNSG